MAVNSFDEILNSVDESDRATLSDLSSRYPDLKNGWLRQSDYSRNLDKLRATEAEYQKYKTTAEAWTEWASNNWDLEANRPKAEKYWNDRANELEAQRGQDMTFDDIKKFATEQGFISKTDLESTLTQKQNEIGESFKGSAYFSAVLNELQGNHIHEFKQPLKTRDFISKLQEYGTNDLDAAYEKYVADDRRKIAEEKHQKELEKIRAEERDKVEQEFRGRGLTLPVDQEAPGVGHFESRVKHVGDPEAMAKATLGDGITARLAAEQYRKDKAGATA